MLAAVIVERVVWAVAAMIILGGALGVIGSENPVHSALSLVATLFGVALMFVLQEAYFLAAIQVIVYAGAIVVLFVFVIMLLGVDRFEVLWGRERALWRRPLAVLAAVAITVLACVGMLATTTELTGAPSATARLDADNDVMVIGRSLFTDYVWAFEITGVLLTVAVVGAVVLSRRPTVSAIDWDEFPVDEVDGEDEFTIDEPQDAGDEPTEVAS
ncbi:MAG: NADH-quinone oxidoreductase subunit J [Microthrixaceae bacterium]|nr:NADH-quinone oxidoreductase subunit J [Microthrixaceae bacterium]